MRINHNIPALNAHRQLNRNSNISASVLERLSSGKRINRAADDAAGMAISEKMKAQVRGLGKAAQNTLDGISLIQTAEGAMNEVHSMLQRMRELAVQSANGTSTDDDRKAIQDEINQLTSEVNRIANGTEFNTRNILRGNEGPNSNTTVHRMSTGSPAQLALSVESGELATIDTTDTLSIFIDREEKIVNLDKVRTTTGNPEKKDALLDVINKALGDSANAIFKNNGDMEITTTSIGGASEIEIKGSVFGSGKLIVGSSKVNGTAESDAGNAKGSFYFEDIPEAGSRIIIGNEVIEFFDSSKEAYAGTNRAIDINGKDEEGIVDEIANLKIDGVKLKKDTTAPGVKERLVVESEDSGFAGHLTYLEGTLEDFNTNLQVGPNQGQGFRLQIGDIRAHKLNISADTQDGNPGVKGAAFTKVPNVTDGLSSNMSEYALDVSTEEMATAAITVYNNAIVQVADLRGALGAIQNRLEYTAANLENTKENLTAALSRIEDTDMALEMSEFTKYNILIQAGTAMLAQANQRPQTVLQLLGN